MPHLSEKRRRLFSNANLITKWQNVFHVASLRSLLGEYLDKETLNEICDENVDLKIGVDRLHRQVIAANDD